MTFGQLPMDSARDAERAVQWFAVQLRLCQYDSAVGVVSYVASLA